MLISYLVSWHHDGDDDAFLPVKACHMTCWPCMAQSHASVPRVTRWQHDSCGVQQQPAFEAKGGWATREYILINNQCDKGCISSGCKFIQQTHGCLGPHRLYKWYKQLLGALFEGPLLP
jgi:hypothetical protein